VYTGTCWEEHSAIVTALLAVVVALWRLAAGRRPPDE